MPPITSREIAIALDMRGCPNRCRHCYLGCWPNPRMTEDDLRWAAEQFRRATLPGEGQPFVQRLTVHSWVREPDFSDDYARLYELEAELSDGPPTRYELLSVWRLARDAHYAAWAKRVGPDTCQISFFGLEGTQDWFYRRRGAFRDCLLATERLLEAGIKPRWQLFLTRKLIPDLGGLLKLVDTLRLRERVAALGGAFQLFMHTPGPDGEARKIEHLRPTLEETAAIPREIVEASRQYLRRERLWRTEAELVAEIEATPDTFPYAYAHPAKLTFYILGNWDVFANIATLEPWWCLGNLRRDGAEAILARFIASETSGLRAIYTVPARELARRFGDRASQRIYTDRGDLEALYVARYCEWLYSIGGEHGR